MSTADRTAAGPKIAPKSTFSDRPDAAGSDPRGAAPPQYLILLLVFCLFFAAAALVTYPLIFHLHDKVPHDLGDPLFISWVVSWNNDFFLSGDYSLERLFNANIYYPYKYTLAYSDLMLVPSLLVLPVYAATNNPLITVNLLIIFLLAFSGFAMFLLTRYLTGGDAAGIVAGALYAFSTFHIAHLGHTQLHTDGFILLTLLYLHKFMDSRRPACLAAAFAFLAATALSSWYYTIYSGLLIALFFAYFIFQRRLRADKKTIIRLVAYLGGTAAVVYPFLRFYLNLHQSMPSFERSLAEAAFYSASPLGYLLAVPSNLLWGRWLGMTESGVENLLFPGLAVIVLAIIGLLGQRFGLRERQGHAQIRFFYLGVALIGFTLSLGPYKKLFGQVVPLPFALPYFLVPGFKSMRVPARFGLFFLIGLTVAAAYGFQRLFEHWRASRVKSRRVDAAAAVILTFIVFQHLSTPALLSPSIASGEKIAPIYTWLARSDTIESFIEFPLAQSEQVKYVYYSTYHKKRLLNGYSGYTPPLWMDMKERLADFPTTGGISWLGRLGADGILVHTDKMPDWRRRFESRELKNLKLVKQFGPDKFFRIIQDGGGGVVPAAMRRP